MEPRGIDSARLLTRSPIVTTTPSTDSLHRPDPESVARSVRAHWTVTRDRLARGAECSPPDPIDRRLEAIEAAVFDVFKLAHEACDLAALAAEHADSEHP